MNILLINPPYLLSKDSPYSKTGAVLPPLGLLYIAAYVREKYPAFSIQILDSPAYKLTLERFEERLKSFSPEIVGISIYTTTFSVAMKTARVVKKLFPKCIIVVGGPHASILPEECLSFADIDIAVIGEGEEVFGELLECLQNNRDIDKVQNIAYKKDGKILRTPFVYKTINLDTLPMPARDLVEMKLYSPAMGTYKRLPATNMITSRGCPFSCIFCQKNIFGSRYRAQSPLKIIAEMETLIEKYNIREVLFNDDVFTVNKERIETLCDLLIERKLDFTWSCSSRVNLVNPKLLEKMRKSGCVGIGYGIEAGDPDILKKISKGFSLKDAREAMRWTKDVGMEVRAFYILGFPGETKETIQRTINLSFELDADFVIYNIATPFPGTRMYEEAKANNLLLYDGIDLYDRTDGPHPSLRLEDVTPAELVRFYNSAYRKYYLRPNYILKQCKRIRSFDDLSRYFKGFLAFLNWDK